MALAKKTAPLKKSSRIVERAANTGDHLAVLHLDHYQTYLEIDGVAREFWELIDNKKTLPDIVAVLQKRYPKDAKEVSKRVTSWSQALKKHKLLA